MNKENTRDEGNGKEVRGGSSEIEKGEEWSRWDAFRGKFPEEFLVKFSINF